MGNFPMDNAASKVLVVVGWSVEPQELVVYHCLCQPTERAVARESNPEVLVRYLNQPFHTSI